MVEIPNTLTLDVSDFEAGMVQAMGTTSDFQGTMDNASSIGSTGMLKLGSSLSHLGVSALVVADRITIASEAVQNAQTRQELAQERLNNAVEKYGAGSDQANKAQKELEISTRSLEIAHERYNVRLLFAVGSVLPSFVVGISKAIDVIKSATIANQALAMSELDVEAASGIGIPAALAGAAAIAAIAGIAGYGLAGGFGGGGGGNTTVYANDINVHGVQGPADFGKSLADPRTTR